MHSLARQHRSNDDYLKSKIIRTILCFIVYCIMYEYNGALTGDCWLRFRFNFCVFSIFLN